MDGGMSQNALLEALREAYERPDPNDKALTVREMSKANGWSIRRTRDVLRDLVEDGKAKPVRVYRSAIDGRKSEVPGYLLAA